MTGYLILWEPFHDNSHPELVVETLEEAKLTAMAIASVDGDVSIWEILASGVISEVASVHFGNNCGHPEGAHGSWDQHD